MIKRVQIKNFKCYGDPGVDFTLKRVNFIFGDNSAGKSTFLQLLRMVFNEEKEALDTGFSQLVFKGDVERSIKMRITAIGTKGQREKDFAKSETTKLGKDDPFYDIFGESATTLFPCPVCQYEKSKDKTSPLDCIGIFYPAAGENDDGKLTRDEDAWPTMRAVIHDYIPHVIHIEASRPARMSESSLDANKSSLNKTFVESGEIEYVNKFFKQLSVPYSLGATGGRLKDEIFGLPVSRNNVGAGIDGLLEVAQKLYEWRTYKEPKQRSLLEIMRNEDPGLENGHALLALEEPESHVNERQISPLVEILFNEAAEGPDRQLIIECHSELMLLKAMQLLREKATAITADDVQILYAEKKENGTEIRECKIAEDGTVYNWPDENGFFPERDKIIFGE